MVDVVVRLHDPTDPSTECTAPPSSAHVQLRGRVPSARRCDDGDDDATDAGLRLSTAMI